MATSIDKNTAKLMVERLQGELNQLFAEQENRRTRRKLNKIKKAQQGLKVEDDPYLKQLEILRKNPFIGEINLGVMNQRLNSMTPKFGLSNQENFSSTLANSPKQLTNKPFDWKSFGQNALELAPAVYNLIKGVQKPDEVKPNYNPYGDKIRSLMRDRRFNAEPLLAQNRIAQAISNKNIRNTARSRGEQMGNYGASQNYRMAADARDLATAQNENNRYLAEQAEMDYYVGRDISQMDWATQTAQAQNKAQRNMFLGQSMNDFANWGQMQELMGNKKMHDSQLIDIYKDMYKYYLPYMNNIQSMINSIKFS